MGQEHRQARAGNALAGRFFAVFWDAVGDWEWLSHTFGLNVWKVTYNCQEICFRCPACVRGRYGVKLLHVDAVIFAPKLARTTADLIAAVAPVPELVQLDGFELGHSVLWNWMHVSPLGIQHKSCGACLVELCVEGRFGTYRGEWKVRVGIALKGPRGVLRLVQGPRRHPVPAAVHSCFAFGRRGGRLRAAPQGQGP